MKLIKGMTIIFVCLILGELISIYFPIPLPGNIIGMLLLFIGLASNIINLQSVEKAGDLFLDNLILFFVPIGVGIIQYKDLLLTEIPSIIVVGVGGFLLLFVIMGKVIDIFAQKGKVGSDNASGNN